MEPKDIEKAEQAKKELAKAESVIASQWKSFSQTEAFKDLMDYYHNISEMLIDYAKERVMPSPVKSGEQIILDNETCSSLLQNVRGSDIIVTYIEQYIEK